MRRLLAAAAACVAAAGGSALWLTDAPAAPDGLYDAAETKRCLDAVPGFSARTLFDLAGYLSVVYQAGDHQVEGSLKFHPDEKAAHRAYDKFYVAFGKSQAFAQWTNVVLLWTGGERGDDLQALNRVVRDCLRAADGSAPPPRSKRPPVLARTFTSATCKTDDEMWMGVVASLKGLAKPYRPYRGRAVVNAFRRAGFTLDPKNQVADLYERGIQDGWLCDFRLYTTNVTIDGVFSDRPLREGVVELWVMADPAAAKDYEEVRLHVARRDKHVNRTTLRRGNVVVDYDTVSLARGRRSRLEDVRRVLAGL